MSGSLEGQVNKIFWINAEKVMKIDPFLSDYNSAIAGFVTWRMEVNKRLTGIVARDTRQIVLSDFSQLGRNRIPSSVRNSATVEIYNRKYLDVKITDAGEQTRGNLYLGVLENKDFASRSFNHQQMLSTEVGGLMYFAILAESL